MFNNNRKNHYQPGPGYGPNPYGPGYPGYNQELARLVYQVEENERRIRNLNRRVRRIENYLGFRNEDEEYKEDFNINNEINENNQY